MKTTINRTIFFLLAGATILYSCQKEAGNGADSRLPHSASIFLTDHATPVFDSVYIDLQGLEVKVEDEGLSNGGWVAMTIRPGIYNILRFRNGLDTLFATGTLPNARIQKIKLVLGTRNTAVKNGQSFPLRVKDEDREVIADLSAASFEISAPGQLRFWIDFDAGNSIQVDNSGSGNNNGYRLRSHIRVFANENTGRLEGRVGPAAADVIVKAFTGTDTAMAIPGDDEGEFKIVGLNPGTYTVLYDGQNGYRDTTITGVIVRNREDTHLPTVRLRQ